MPNFPVMLQMFHIFLIFAVIIIIGKSTVVRSARFCGFSSKVSTCPGDNQLEIIFPFWIENRTADDNGECINYPGFQVKCAENRRPVINISNNLYYVLNLYNHHTENGFLTVADVGIDAQECPSPKRNISIKPTRFLEMADSRNMTIFYNCSSRLRAMVQQIPCLENNNDNTTGRSFAFLDEEISSHPYDWYNYCEEAVVVPVDSNRYDDQIEMNYTRALKEGFTLFWTFPVNCGNCELSGGKCWANETDQAITSHFRCNCTDGRTLVNEPCISQVQFQSASPSPSPYSNQDDPPLSNQDLERIFNVVILVVMVILLGGLLLLLFCLVICIRCCCQQLSSLATRWRKRLIGRTNVEVFLENNYRDLSIQNYKHSDIKKMTNSFKDMLGQGGFGSVFKGKLCNGQLVAVKVLNESKGKGDDFVNEVATIGRTNHINVVSLLGVCAENKKRALVYEFMSNGSLEKFIHASKDSSTTSPILGWEKLYQIALGIARGLEYLHGGCSTPILHLDIKPHNILLDQDFCPKISDFGLAKLCPTRESIVSLAGGLGTPGYTAPEVFSGNLGDVSHKSDVFSYGMMVFEIIGGRKNLDLNVDTSKIHFPQWIYKRLQDNINAEVSENNEVVASGEVFEVETVKKMTIVALWCTQAHPEERPSMNEVVNMLEGNIEDLHFPPNPFPSHSATSI